MKDHLAAIEFFFPQQDLKQRRFSRPVSADKSHFDAVGDRRFGIVKQNLIAVSFVGTTDLDKNCHESPGVNIELSAK